MNELAVPIITVDEGSGTVTVSAKLSQETSAKLKSKAFAKIYSRRLSRDALRESMMAKAKDVIENGIGTLDLVKVVEYR